MIEYEGKAPDFIQLAGEAKDFIGQDHKVYFIFDVVVHSWYGLYSCYHVRWESDHNSFLKLRYILILEIYSVNLTNYRFTNWNKRVNVAHYVTLVIY